MATTIDARNVVLDDEAEEARSEERRHRDEDDGRPPPDDRWGHVCQVDTCGPWDCILGGRRT